MYSKIAISACRRVSHECRQISSALMVLKNVSTVALSGQYFGVFCAFYHVYNACLRIPGHPAT
jgi:hypothetical protein